MSQKKPIIVYRRKGGQFSYKRSSDTDTIYVNSDFIPRDTLTDIMERMWDEIKNQPKSYRERPICTELAERVYKSIEGVTGISADKIYGKGRKASFVFARMIFCKILSEMGERKISISDAIYRTHPTVLHLIKRFDIDRKYIKKLEEDFQEIRARVWDV